MKKCFHISNYNKFICVLLLLTSLFVWYRLNHIPDSNCSEVETKLTGILVRKKINGDLLTFIVRGKEKVVVFYQAKTLTEKEQLEKMPLGSTVFLEGSFERPDSRRNFYLFDYRNYLLSQKIQWLFSASDISYQDTSTWYYQLRNAFYDHLPKSSHIKSYMKAFLFGDLGELDLSCQKEYRENGISHLFAISGMHISLLASFLMWVFSKGMKNAFLPLVITSGILFFYLFLSGFAISACRATVFFILLKLKKLGQWKCSNLQLYLCILCCFLWLNPYSVYHVGFLYSFSICFFFSLFSIKIQGKNYFSSLLKTSLLAFLGSLPITVNQSFQVCVISVFANLFFVPLVSFTIFPLCLCTFVFPFLSPLLNVLLNFMEVVSHVIYSLSIFRLSFAHFSGIELCLYYSILLLFYRKSNWFFLLLLVGLFLHYQSAYLRSTTIVTMLDVGQGDCLVILPKHSVEAIVIDTGGKPSFVKESWRQRQTSSISEQIIVPYLKAMGIRKIGLLVLTHGDYDHIGEAISLVNQIKVKQVMSNSAVENQLETTLFQALSKKQIFYQKIKQLTFRYQKIDFMVESTGSAENENQDSLMIDAKIEKKHILFMGDADSVSERYLLEAYSFPKVDILKVGHHGSITSSSGPFLEQIQPSIALISVGSNNRYGHPNEIVLQRLQALRSTIYMTKDHGSVSIFFQKQLKIKNCYP